MKKTPFITLEKAKEIAAQIPTPFHLYDEAGIRANARALIVHFLKNLRNCVDDTFSHVLNPPYNAQISRITHKKLF